MGRTKGAKNGTTSVAPYRDYNLMVRIKNGDKAAEVELFNTYKDLMYKQYHLRRDAIKANNWYGLEVGTPTDFVAECWEPFTKAVATTDLSQINHCPVYDSKIKKTRKVVGYEDHSEKWSFYVTFWGYIKKMNEVEIAHYIKEHKNEVSMDITVTKNEEEVNLIDMNMPADLVTSAEDELLKDLEQKIYKSAISAARAKFAPIQCKIWAAREEGLSQSEIVKQEAISLKEFKQNIAAMKSILNKEITKYNMMYHGSNKLF